MLLLAVSPRLMGARSRMDSGMRMEECPSGWLPGATRAPSTGFPRVGADRADTSVFRYRPGCTTSGVSGLVRHTGEPPRGILGGTTVKQTYRVISGLIALGVLVQA